MAYSQLVRDTYSSVLNDLKTNGIFKEERAILSPQNSEIDVEFPIGSTLRKEINMCANNYLGLSSHPDVIKAAHVGLDSRGYGMSSVRFICGTQDIHKDLEKSLRNSWEQKIQFYSRHVWMQMQVYLKLF